MLRIKPVSLKTSINYLLTKSGNRVTTFSEGNKITKSVINNGVDSIEKKYSIKPLKKFFLFNDGYEKSVEIKKNGEFESDTVFKHDKNGKPTSILKYIDGLPMSSLIYSKGKPSYIFNGKLDEITTL